MVLCTKISMTAWKDATKISTQQGKNNSKNAGLPTRSTINHRYARGRGNKIYFPYTEEKINRKQK